MKKIEIGEAVLHTEHKNQKIKTQAKQALEMYHKVEAADPALKAGFVVDDADRLFLCVGQSGYGFVVMIYDNWERCYKCQVLPGARREGVSIVYPPAMQRTKTLSAGKIRKEIERAILINERYKAAQEVKRTAIKATKTQILDNGGTIKKETDCDFIATIERGGLQMVVLHVSNDHFLYQLNVIAPPTIDNFLKMANNKYQLPE